MVRAAFGYSITAIVVFIFFSLSGCKKLDKDNPVKVYIKAHVPYNNEPIPHVKYTIREYKSKKGGSYFDVEYTDFELTGNTDANGIAEISFFRKKNQKYYYDIVFDYSSVEIPFTEYTYINAPTVAKIQKSEPNSFEIRVLPNMNINYKIENINCSGVSDSMRIILRNLDEEYYLDFNYEEWSPYFSGCYTEIDNFNHLGGRYVYKIQVIRSGILNEYIDTILVAPGVNNNLFIEY